MVRTGFLIAVAAALAGCEPATFYTDLEGQATVKGDPTPISDVLGALPAIGSFTSMDFDANRDFRNLGITKDQVGSVKVASFTLRIISPSNQDFSFLDQIGFYAKVGDSEAEVADKADVAALGLRAPNPTLSLDVENVELQPFVSARAMSIIMRGSGRMPPRDTRIEAVVRLKVGVKLLSL